MHISSQTLPTVVIGGRDEAIGRAIEAGVYAEHLLATHSSNHDWESLEAVARRGREAAELFWWVGVKMAMQAAGSHAQRTGAPVEELFQDACLAVAEAIRRFDHSRGTRWTTLVHTRIKHALLDASEYRVGLAASSRADRRAAHRASRLADDLAAEGVSVGLARAAEAAGVSAAAVTRAKTRLVSIEDVQEADLSSGVDDVAHAGPGVDFLDLLEPHHRQVLELRFGIGCEPLTLAETARRLRATTSTIHRWEKEAIGAARDVLDRERTTAAPQRGAAAWRVGA
jgi:RNA polymerase sigma factor (sigma-70 family)